MPSPDVSGLIASYLDSKCLNAFFHTSSSDPATKFIHHAHVRRLPEFHKIYDGFPNCVIKSVTFDRIDDPTSVEEIYIGKMRELITPAIVNQFNELASQEFEAKQIAEAVNQVQQFEALAGLELYENFLQTDTFQIWRLCGNGDPTTDAEANRAFLGLKKYNDFVAHIDALFSSPSLSTIYTDISSTLKKNHTKQKFRTYCAHLNSLPDGAPLNLLHHASQITNLANKLEQALSYTLEKTLTIHPALASVNSITFQSCSFPPFPFPPFLPLPLPLPPTLHTLKIIQCEQIIELSSLSSLNPNLTHLEIINTQIPDPNLFLSSSLTLRNLLHLKLIGIKTISSTNFLQYTPSLTTLNLSSCYNLTILTNIPSSILHLNLSRCHTLVDITSLSSCINLKTLDLSSTSITTTISFHTHPSITTLKLSYCNNLFPTHIHPIQSSKLKRFIAKSCSPITTIQFLSPNTILSTLTITHNNLNSISDLSCFTTLKTLDLSASTLLYDFSILTQMTALQNFTLTKSSIHILPLIPSLRFLKLTHCPHIKNYTIIRQFQLQHLILERTHIKDTSFIEECISLQTLSLIQCFLLTQITPLNSCTFLSRVHLSECIRLNSFTLTSPNLTNVSIWSCVHLTDINSLTKCPKLQEVTVYKCNPSMSNLILSNPTLRIRNGFGSLPAHTLNTRKLICVDSAKIKTDEVNDNDADESIIDNYMVLSDSFHPIVLPQSDNYVAAVDDNHATVINNHATTAVNDHTTTAVNDHATTADGNHTTIDDIYATTVVNDHATVINNHTTTAINDYATTAVNDHATTADGNHTAIGDIYATTAVNDHATTADGNHTAIGDIYATIAVNDHATTADGNHTAIDDIYATIAVNDHATTTDGNHTTIDDIYATTVDNYHTDATNDYNKYEQCTIPKSKEYTSMIIDDVINMNSDTTKITKQKISAQNFPNAKSIVVANTTLNKVKRFFSQFTNTKIL